MAFLLYRLFFSFYLFICLFAILEVLNVIGPLPLVFWSLVSLKLQYIAVPPENKNFKIFFNDLKFSNHFWFKLNIFFF